jgi:(2R)-sulfolactate sulfo-lyase subunit alpha
MPEPDFVVHHPDDSVGVVVVETIAPARRLSGWTLETGAVLELHAVDAVPLGHKLALRDIAAGETVLKYGQDIGRAVAPIARGAHVHVHNLKTKRW